MKQETALKLMKSGENVFLTGSAGAGKTYTLNQYIHYLKVRKVPVAITASTGIAATHMNGMTIHTWAGIGIKDFLSDDDLKRMKTHLSIEFFKRSISSSHSNRYSKKKKIKIVFPFLETNSYL